MFVVIKISTDFSLCWKIFPKKDKHVVISLVEKKERRLLLTLFSFITLPLEQNFAKELFVLGVSSVSPPVLHTGPVPLPIPSLTLFSVIVLFCDLEAAKSSSQCSVPLLATQQLGAVSSFLKYFFTWVSGTSLALGSLPVSFYIGVSLGLGPTFFIHL